MSTLIALVDSDAFVEAVGWDEYLVLVYELAQGRPPTAWELRVLTGIHADLEFKRSDALAYALRGNDAALTWDQVRTFLGHVSAADFVPDEARKSAAAGLAKAAATVDLEAAAPEAATEMPGNAKAISVEKDAPGLAYNTYFGYLHAHCELSDGRGTAMEAYTYAREQGGLDFFALTDHGEFLVLWPWQERWSQLRAAADATYDPGNYVTLWGFEWSNPFLGHINIINSEDFTDTFRTFRIKELYQWIAARPEAFARFNHPGRFDPTKREGAKIFEDVIPQFVGIETWNTNNGFGVYHYERRHGCRAGTYLDGANQLGWRLGAEGGQDNHRKQWGTLNQMRTAILSQELTREAIVDAHRQRRFYATEDRDLFLDVRSNGYPMGTQLGVDSPRDFTVSARDESGDVFTEVRLYRSGELLEARMVNSNSITENFSDTHSTTGEYYYVMVTQGDDNDGDGRGDEALSSPIWFGTFAPRWGCASFQGDWWAHPLGLVNSDGLVFLGMGGVLLLLARRRLA